MSYKIIKYAHKYNKSKQNKYLKKLFKHICNVQQTGGVYNFSLNTSLKQQKLYGLIHLMMQTISPLIDNIFNNNYLVIVMGPPGAGKTIARKVAIREIMTLENMAIEYNNSMNTFIDISIDDYVTGSINNGISGSAILKHNVERVLANLNIDDFEKLTEENSKTFYNEMYSQYNIIRKEVNPISFIMLYLAAYLKLNIFFETTGGEWILDELIISFCNETKYVPVVVYPRITQYSDVKKRIADRGLREHRFVSEENITRSIQNANTTYNKIIEYNKKHDGFIKMYTYNAGININDIEKNGIDQIQIL